MRRLLWAWLLLNPRLWLLGRVGCASLQMDVGGVTLAAGEGASLCEGRKPQDGPVTGEKRFHWSSWQPWICMCNLHKQARIRHLVAWGANITLRLQAKEFWEERPCSLQECVTCKPEECPGSWERSGWGSPLESLPPVNPHDSEIPLPPSLDSESYDSLPVVDDMGED